MMEIKLMRSLGKAAGLGGIAAGVLLLLFKRVLQTQFLPEAGLNAAQAFAVIIALLILTFGFAVVGVVASLMSRSTNPKAPIPKGALATLVILAALVLGAATYVVAQASADETGKPVSAKPENTITSMPNNTGIVTQGQTGNNIIIPSPSQSPKPCTDLVDSTFTFLPPGATPKTTVFTPLAKEDLKKRVQDTVTELNRFASDYRKTIADHMKVPQKDFKQQKAELDDLEKQSTVDFQTNILPQARELHFELLRRLNLQWPVCSTSGLSIDGYRTIALGLIGADDSGVINVAKYLENLAKDHPRLSDIDTPSAR